MARHVRELNWSVTSDEVGRRLGKLVEFLVLAENEYQELMQLWQIHGNDDQLVANQLFNGTADAIQLEMVQDLKAGMLAAHTLWQNADLAALRKVN